MKGGGSPVLLRSCAVVMLAGLLGVAAFAQQPAAKPPVDIKADATWSGEVTVDSVVRIVGATLTIAPGTKVTFKPGGVLSVAGALVAKGDADKPVELIGEKCGHIEGGGGKVVLENCRLTGLSDDVNKRALWFSGSVGREGIVLKNCKVTDCGGFWPTLGGPCDVDGCDFRACRGEIRIYGRGGAARVTNNTVEGGNVGATDVAEAVIAGNVVIGGTISSWNSPKVVVELNYVHQPKPGGSYCLLYGSGTTRNNVLSGGSWVSAQLGGEITGNVLISLPSEGAKDLPGGYDRNCTHEHICGIAANARVERNIFIGNSYGAVMGIGANSGVGALIRNNTFDMRGGGRPVYLDHLTKPDASKVVVRNNLFMRCHGIQDERGTADAIDYCDYNLWSDAAKKERFEKITITGKKPGDPGMGGHDVPPIAQNDKQPAPAAVVVNPDIAFPFSDEEMLARKHTPAEVLKIYRDAYALKPGSPAINAGDPADKDDPAVKDGKPDIGAIEFEGK